MKFYFCARSSRWSELLELAKEFNEAGHIVTSRWIQGDHIISDEDIVKPENTARVGQYASEDLRDLEYADAVVAFTESPRTASRGGRHVEWGFAINSTKLLIRVGPVENAFYGHSDVNGMDTVDELRAWMLRHGR